MGKDCYGDRGNHPIAITLVTVFGLALASVCITWFYHVFYKKKTLSQEKKEQLRDVKAIKNVSRIAFGLYTLGVFILLLSLLICDPTDMIYGSGSSCIAFAMTLVMVVFSLRLHFTFDHTPYALSNRNKYYLIFVVCCIFGSFFIFCFLFIFSLASYNVALIGAACTVLFLVLNSLILLFVFIKKLNEVINAFISEYGTITGIQLSTLNKSRNASAATSRQLSRQVSDDIQQGGFDSTVTKDVFKNMRSLSKLIKDMSRYTILVGIAIVSSFIFALFALIITLTIGQIEFYWITCALLYDSIVNTICLSLQFEFARKRYYIACKDIHNKCQDRYTKRANNSNDIDGFMLKRLESGEIGLVPNDGNNSGGSTGIDSGTTGTGIIIGAAEVDFATTEIELGDKDNNNNNKDNDNDDEFKAGGAITTLGMASGIGNVMSNDKKGIAQNTIAVVAQKSANMQLETTHDDDNVMQNS